MWMTKRAKVSLVLGAVLLLVWVVLLRPWFLGGPSGYFVVAGRSMEPRLHSGDVAITIRQDTYAEGDIVAYRVEDASILHRIIGGTAIEGYIVQGDNRDTPDRWRPTAEQIVGRLWLDVPGAGQYLLFLRQPLGLGILVTVMAIIFLLPLLRRESRHQRRTRQNKLRVLKRRKERALARWLPFPVARLVSRFG